MTTWLPIAFAPFVGSFLALLSVRLPKGEGFVAGRSHCRACNAVLRPADLVPFISFFASGGRCRHCGVAISWRYPGFEAAALLIAASAVAADGAMVWAGCGLGWTLLLLGVVDFEHWLLPDGLTLPLALAGLILAPVGLDAGLIGMLVGFAAFAGLGLVYRWLRGRDGLGLGDAKLLAAAGAWLGWAALPMVVLLAALLGLGAALGLRLAGRKIDAATAIPFGPALCAAIWIAWLI